MDDLSADMQEGAEERKKNLDEKEEMRRKLSEKDIL